MESFRLGILQTICTHLKSSEWIKSGHILKGCGSHCKIIGVSKDPLIGYIVKLFIIYDNVSWHEGCNFEHVNISPHEWLAPFLFFFVFFLLVKFLLCIFFYLFVGFGLFALFSSRPSNGFFIFWIGPHSVKTNFT